MENPFLPDGRCLHCGGAGCRNCDGIGSDRSAIREVLAVDDDGLLVHGTVWDVSLQLAFQALKFDPAKPLVVKSMAGIGPLQSRRFQFVDAYLASDGTEPTMIGKEVMEETRSHHFGDDRDDMLSENYIPSPAPRVHWEYVIDGASSPHE